MDKELELSEDAQEVNSPVNVEEGEDIELLTCAEESRRYVISF